PFAVPFLGEPNLYRLPNWIWPFSLFVLLPMGFAAPLGTTILGWVAVWQIRRSAGKIYGLGLAGFWGLFFPLLALNALILMGAIFVIRLKASAQLENERGFAMHTNSELTVIVFLALIVAVDWLIIRSVWRRVNGGAIGSEKNSVLRFWSSP